MAVLRPPILFVAKITILLGGVLLCVLACNCPASAQDEPASPPKVIYLTFDDGPSGYTQPILDTLARYNAKATFFVVGRQAAGNLPLLQAMVDAGHGVANHTYHHPMLTNLATARIDEEVRATAAVLGVLDQGCLRPPYGAANKTVRAEAESLGYTVILWTIDPRDWSRPGAATIANRVIQRAAPNAIVVLHDGGGDRSQTVAAVETILAALSQQGYMFEALCRDGSPKLPAPTIVATISAATAATSPAPLVDSVSAPQVVDLPNCISTPTDGAAVHGLVPVKGIALHPEFRKWQLDLLIDGASETFLAFGEQPLLEDGELLSWDTTLYPDGNHKLRLRVVRDGLNYDEYFAQVTIDNTGVK